MSAQKPAYSGHLTPAHHDLISQVRDQWMSAGLSTQRADRPACGAAVCEAYIAAGLRAPEFVVWMDSPLGGALASSAVGQLGGQLGGQLWDHLGGQLWGQLRGQIGDQIGGQLWDAFDPWYEAYWMAYYQAGLTVAGMHASDRLGTLARATQGMGWWWPMHGVAVLTDRPTTITRDSLGRLHSETGPALAYADGYGLWSWHGTSVPQDLIETGWDTSRILSEENAEVRRCAIERMGWDTFVTQAGLTQVGQATPDPGNPGHVLTLYDVPEQIYGEPIRVLLCTNGTPERDGARRRFGLTVPADMPDPVSAAIWGYGLTREQYLTAQRRS